MIHNRFVRIYFPDSKLKSAVPGKTGDTFCQIMGLLMMFSKILILILEFVYNYLKVTHNHTAKHLFFLNNWNTVLFSG